MRIFVLLFAAIIASAATGVQAVAPQRTFVSTAGSDANTASNCSIGAPCRSFTSALTVTAPNGEIIVLESGGYGPVTITQGVTIQAPAGVYAGISVSSGDGITVNAAGATVILRGLSINGLGGDRGILLTAADTLRIERCTITNMAGDAVQGLAAAGSHVHIFDALIASNGAYGVNLKGPALLEVERTRVERNVGVGIWAENIRGVTLRDSALVKNGNYAIEVITSAAVAIDASVERVLAAENGGGVLNAFAASSGNIGIAITHSTFSDNNASTPGVGTVRLNAASPSQVLASIEQSVIQRNNADAVQVIGTGVKTTVSNSAIVSNQGYALSNAGGTLYTRQNNTIRGNFFSELTFQTLGTITNLAGS